MTRHLPLDARTADRIGAHVDPKLIERRDAAADRARAIQAEFDKIPQDLPEKKFTERMDEIQRRFDEAIAEFDRLDDQISNVLALEARATQRPHPGDATVRGNGGAYFEPSDEPGEAIALRSGETFAQRIANRMEGPDEFSGLSTGAFLRAMVTGPKSDAERRALAEGTDSAGGYTVPDILSARLIDRMRAASVVFRAGAQTVPIYSDTNYIAKVASDPVPAWRAENASINESDPTFGRVTLTPRSVAVLVKVSRELLEDTLNIDTALPNLISVALAQELDRAALLGSGTPPEPKGVVNFSGLTSNTFAGGVVSSYAPLIAARTALRTANSDVTAFVMSPREDGTFAGLVDGQGQPLNVPPAIANVPLLVTSKMPTDGGSGSDESQIIAGDWSRLMVGIRSQIRIEILRERYADTHQYAFVAHMRADVAAEHEAAFTVLDAITLT